MLFKSQLPTFGVVNNFNCFYPSENIIFPRASYQQHINMTSQHRTQSALTSYYRTDAWRYVTMEIQLRVTNCWQFKHIGDGSHGQWAIKQRTSIKRNNKHQIKRLHANDQSANHRSYSMRFQQLIRHISNRIAISLFQHNGTLALTVNSQVLKKTAGLWHHKEVVIN